MRIFCVSALFSLPQTLLLFYCSQSSLAPKRAWPQCLQALKYKCIYKSLFEVAQLLVVAEASLYHITTDTKDHDWNQQKSSLNLP